METLEKRLGPELVYDTLMDISSQMGLYRPGMKIHHIGNLQQILSFKIGSIEKGICKTTKNTTFSEFKITEPEDYKSIFYTILEAMIDYEIKI